MVGKVLLAFALDAVAGEPRESLHPVRWMGKLVEALDRSLAGRSNALVARATGAAVALTLPAGVYLAARGLLRALPRPLAGATEVALLWVSLSGRSLYEGGMAVAASLEEGGASGSGIVRGGGSGDGAAGSTGSYGGTGGNGSLEAGRRAVSRLVGRDTDALNEQEVVRAAVESVAENTNDGVVAPLFYGFLGGAPLALAYKMVNTLDSMIGYRNSRYADFGWAAARLDDAAGYLPARLTAAAVVAASPAASPAAGTAAATAARGLQRFGAMGHEAGQPGAGSMSGNGGSAAAAWRVWRCEAAAHASPNAGVCEGAFAGALGVRLGGESTYGGKAVRKAVLGKDFDPPARCDIARATALMYSASLLFLVAAAACRWAWDRGGRPPGSGWKRRGGRDRGAHEH